MSSNSGSMLGSGVEYLIFSGALSKIKNAILKVVGITEDARAWDRIRESQKYLGAEIKFWPWTMEILQCQRSSSNPKVFQVIITFFGVFIPFNLFEILTTFSLLPRPLVALVFVHNIFARFCSHGKIDWIVTRDVESDFQNWKSRLMNWGKPPFQIQLVHYRTEKADAVETNHWLDVTTNPFIQYTTLYSSQQPLNVVK